METIFEFGTGFTQEFLEKDTAFNNFVDLHYGGSIDAEARKKLCAFFADVLNSRPTYLVDLSQIPSNIPVSDVLKMIKENTLDLGATPEPHLNRLYEKSSNQMNNEIPENAPNPDDVPHTVTDADLKANPDLAENGINTGDVIQIPFSPEPTVAGGTPTNTNLSDLN